MSWLEETVKHLTAIFPRVAHVQANEGGVKFKKGEAIEIEPGLTFYWPLTSEVSIINVSRQVLSIGPINMEDDAGRTFSASAIIVYRIDDTIRHLVDNENPESGIDDICQSILMDSLVGKTILSFDHQLENDRMTQQARSELESFGINVEYMRLQSLAHGSLLIHAGVEFGGSTA